ncbi:MAG: hypothetical protein HQL60_06960 [Magnetococcales bacterium]|nr:hypothetical protein [Magnetococcales bacterium]
MQRQHVLVTSGAGSTGIATWINVLVNSGRYDLSLVGYAGATIVLYNSIAVEESIYGQ